MPITDPPLNATCSAVDRPVRAAAVVRTLALVATRIPKKPARPDAQAPMTKAAAMSGVRP
jgi:hypothetical protein